MPRLPDDTHPLEIAKACGAYYCCPKDADGNRLGPLVGYAGTYGPRKAKKQFVGEEFINFAKIERFPSLVDDHIVQPLLDAVQDVVGRDISFQGAPQGGLSLATLLARAARAEYGYPDKIELVPATATSRAQSGLRYGRHEVEGGSSTVIVEDVCNNFSTTGDFIEELVRHGAKVRAVVCFLNRSVTVGDTFRFGGATYPVIALWTQPIPEYRQDDPYVAADIAAGNVFWKPKDRWQELPQAA